MNYKGLKLMGFMMIVLPLTASSVLAASGTLSVGVMGGWGWSTTGCAVRGSYTEYPETEFKSSGIYGVNIMERYPSGYALELCVEHLALDLEESGENFGTLKMTPVMLLFKYQGMPRKRTGFTGHADIGGGISLNS